MSENEDFDWQAAQHHDRMLLQQSLVEQLKEVHDLVFSCSDSTQLTERDVKNIAAACGVYTEYLQAINPQPKLKEESEHAHR